MDIDRGAGPSGHRRRQLHRSRICADVCGASAPGSPWSSSSAQLLPREDEDVSDGIRAILEAEGIDVPPGRPSACRCPAMRRQRGGRRRVRHGVARNRRLVMCCWPSAGGPTPTTWASRLRASSSMRAATSWSMSSFAPAPKGVWAMGDCNGRGAFTHTACNDYEIVAANLFDGDPRRVSDRIPCLRALHRSAALGRVGMTEREVRASGRKALGCARCRCSASAARSEAGETQGFMKALVDADTKRLLGAAILGLEWRRSGSLIARRHGGRPALHGHFPGRAHPSDSQ